MRLGEKGSRPALLEDLMISQLSPPEESASHHECHSEYKCTHVVHKLAVDMKGMREHIYRMLLYDAQKMFSLGTFQYALTPGLCICLVLLWTCVWVGIQVYVNIRPYAKRRRPRQDKS